MIIPDYIIKVILIGYFYSAKTVIVNKLIYGDNKLHKCSIEANYFSYSTSLNGKNINFNIWEIGGT
jgi:hypothetical protein